MFSLIITLISLVLVGAIVVATIMYLGSPVTKANASAQAAALIAQSDQIQAASDAYTVDTGGQAPAALTDLVPRYMSSVPAGWQNPGSLQYPISSKTVTDVNVCLAFDKKEGYQSIPSCSSLTSVSAPVCCD